MKKLKFLIVVVMFTSAYAEKNITKWLDSSPVNRIVYAHMRFKERKHWLHKDLVAGTGIKREKILECTNIK